MRFLPKYNMYNTDDGLLPLTVIRFVSVIRFVRVIQFLSVIQFASLKPESCRLEVLNAGAFSCKILEYQVSIWFQFLAFFIVRIRIQRL